MSVSPVSGAVAAVGLAGNDGGSQHALGQIIGSFQVIDIQETQEMRAMFAQAFGKAEHCRDRDSLRWGPINVSRRASKSRACWRKCEADQAGFLCFQGQALPARRSSLGGRSAGPVHFGSRSSPSDLAADARRIFASARSSSAVVIGQETVRSQDAVELSTQNIEQHIAAAIIPDGIDADFANW